MPHAQQDLPRLNAIAAAQGGVVGRADLRACGFSADATARRIAAGIWQRVGAAVIVSTSPVTSTPSGPRSAGAWSAQSHPPRHGTDGDGDDLRWAWILLLTFGASSVISGALALRRAGWHLPDNSHIVVLPHKPRAHIRGVIVVRRRSATSVQTTDGRNYATAADALLDTLITVADHQRAEVIDAALQQRLVTTANFAEWIEPRLGRGHTGAASLRAALTRISSGSRSEAEQRMATLLRKSRTGTWERNHPVHDPDGRIIAEIDFALLDSRIAIEVDGRAHHTDRRSFERDRERQNLLMLRGWFVLRFTWDQITRQPADVIDTVVAAVRGRAA